MSRMERLWVDRVLPLWLAAATLALGLAWSGHEAPPSARPVVESCVL